MCACAGMAYLGTFVAVVVVMVSACMRMSIFVCAGMSLGRERERVCADICVREIERYK